MSYRLIQVTDCHLLTDKHAHLKNTNTYAALENMLLQLIDQPHDALLFTGDLAQDELASTYQHYIELTQDWPAPIYWLPGNHDDPTAMAHVLCAEPWHITKHLDLGPWRIILLNSHWPGHIEGQLSNAELQRLTALLDEHGVPVLLFVHHHLTYTEMGLVNTAELLSTLVPYKDRIQAITSGHVHAEYDGQFEGFRHLTTPSTCFQFKMIDGKATIDDALPGYRTFILDTTGLWKTHITRLDSKAKKI